MSSKEPPIPPCFDCGDDPINRLIEMFVGIAQKKRIRLGQTPAERPVFRKLHGVGPRSAGDAQGHPRRPQGRGLRPEELTAWMRFSSDTSPTSPDLQSTVGIGLKVFGVPGEKAYRRRGRHRRLHHAELSRLLRR
jgi:hypothetical protein